MKEKDIKKIFIGRERCSCSICLDFLYFFAPQNLAHMYHDYENFIKQNLDMIKDGSNCHKELLKEYIRKSPNKIAWGYISRYTRLSFEFIKEFSDKINFKYIPLCYMRMRHEMVWKTFL